MDCIKLQGPISRTQMINILHCDPDGEGEMHCSACLVDMQESTFHLETEDLHGLVAQIKRHCQTACCTTLPTAIAVIATEDTTFGILRMLRALLDNHHMNLFVTRDTNTAIHWLNSQVVN